MKNEPLVSVIVPVYNVEKYLNKCVESIVNQTYKNLEIILVDDGSPDKCPQMCDNLAKNDNRIRVVHKENGGLASARNAGVKLIKGDYYTFVDSDDFIKETFIEILLNRICYDDSQIVSCNFVHSDSSISLPLYNNSGCYSSETIILDFFYRKIEFGSCCGKLYKSNLLKNVENKNVVFIEDQLYNVECLLKTETVSFVEDELYYYSHNPDSLTHQKKPSNVYHEACVEAEKTRAFVINNYPNYTKPINCLIVSHAFFLFLNMLDSNPTEEQKQYCLSIIKKVRKSVLFDNRASAKTRGACLLSYFGMKCVYRLYKVFVKR